MDTTKQQELDINHSVLAKIINIRHNLEMAEINIIDISTDMVDNKQIISSLKTIISELSSIELSLKTNMTNS